MFKFTARLLDDLKLKVPHSRAQTSSPPPTLNAPKILFNCLPNNLHVAVSSAPGQLLFKMSSGLLGLHGASKTAPKAIPLLLDALRAKLGPGQGAVRVELRGVSPCRPHLISGLRRVGLRVLEVSDSTGIAFNGCRPKKTRRL
jgi:small subunit ribosomal protein S11